MPKPKANNSTFDVGPSRNDLDAVRLTCVKAALRAHGGNLNATARSVGITSASLSKMMAADMDLRDLSMEIRESEQREIEAKIIEACKRGQPSLLRFYASHLIRGFNGEPPPRDPEKERQRQEAFNNMVASLQRAAEARAAKPE